MELSDEVTSFGGLARFHRRVDKGGTAAGQVFRTDLCCSFSLRGNPACLQSKHQWNFGMAF